MFAIMQDLGGCKDISSKASLQNVVQRPKQRFQKSTKTSQFDHDIRLGSTLVFILYIQNAWESKREQAVCQVHACQIKNQQFLKFNIFKKWVRKSSLLIMDTQKCLNKVLPKALLMVSHCKYVIGKMHTKSFVFYTQPNRCGSC